MYALIPFKTDAVTVLKVIKPRNKSEGRPGHTVIFSTHNTSQWITTGQSIGIFNLWPVRYNIQRYKQEKILLHAHSCAGNMDWMIKQSHGHHLTPGVWTCADKKGDGRFWNSSSAWINKVNKVRGCTWLGVLHLSIILSLLNSVGNYAYTAKICSHN